MNLFMPYKIKKTELKNRLVMAPMCTHFDITSTEAREYYKKRAEGVGLVIVENTSSELFEEEGFRDKIAPLSTALQEQDTKVLVQLSVSPERTKGVPKADGEEPDWTNELTIPAIASCIHSLRNAALECFRAGYDGIEIHGAHGYFMSTFFNAQKNRRADKYGGTLENRMNFALECVSEIRSHVPEDFILSFRLSGSELVPGGPALEETLGFCRHLETAGADLIHVSAGVADTKEEWVTPSKNAPLGVFADYAAQVKRVVSLPVLSVGKNHSSEICTSILQENKADLIAVGRPFIADCRWAVKVREHKENHINRCIYCNHCLRQISKGIPLNCTVNKEL